MTVTPEIELAVSAALDRKARQIVVLDLRGISNITDYFLICHGTSSRQVQAIADAIAERLSGSPHREARIEGYRQGEWVLMDFIDFVVHIFTGEKRSFFNLERLWGDAPRKPYEDDFNDRSPTASLSRRTASARRDE
ncbi:MAG: ribosome silencing factor [Acidobacteria bacterium]|nr:MAG: ribosome silencing factor [Acidobacteriota bacterium]